MLEHLFLKYIAQEQLSRNTWFYIEKIKEMNKLYSTEILHN